MRVPTIGLDIAKNVFQVHGVAARGRVVLRERLERGQVLAFGAHRQTVGWANGLRARRPFNVVVAAVANKLARIIWTPLSRGEAYRAAA